MNKGQEKSINWIPNAKQQQMAELLANPNDRRTKTDKVKEVGIDYSTLWKWEQRPEFRQYVIDLIDKYTDGEVAFAWRCLKSRMPNDTNAIKLFFELKNLYRDRKEITGEAGGPVKLDMSGLTIQELKRLAQLDE